MIGAVNESSIREGGKRRLVTNRWISARLNAFSRHFPSNGMIFLRNLAREPGFFETEGKERKREGKKEKEEKMRKIFTVEKGKQVLVAVCKTRRSSLLVVHVVNVAQSSLIVCDYSNCKK